MRDDNYQLPAQVFAGDEFFHPGHVSHAVRDRGCAKAMPDLAIGFLEFHKPSAWLWTSSMETEGQALSDWIDWCWTEEFRPEARTHLTVLMTKPVTAWVVDGVASLDALFDEVDCCWDHAVESKNIDVIHLTKSGHHRTRMRLFSGEMIARRPGDVPSTYAWDCESVCWVNDPRPFITSQHEIPAHAHSYGIKLTAIKEPT